MNERIRELCALAKNLTTDKAIHLSRIHNRTLSLDELGEIFDQKFALLIVQECVGVANHSNVNGKSIIGQRIKEHFGVES
jgi:hypothetical protein